MDEREIANSPIGELVTTVEGCRAFVPKPLPRTIDLGQDLTLLLAEASGRVGHLRGVGETLTNPFLLIGPFLRREAVLSSRIEGTQASLSDLYRYEASGRREERRDAPEVWNYVRAVERGQELLETLPISNRLVNEMHAVLMEGVRGEEKRAGEWRRYQVWIGAAGTPIEHARYVPPPHAALPDLMADWERFVNDTTSLPPLVAAALMHYQFEAIHPYADGNGRIGRALITIYLSARGELPTPLLYLSAYFERERSTYYDQLHRLSVTGEWEPWVRFFLTGVSEQAQDAIHRSERVRELHETYRLRLQEAGESANALRMLDGLFAYPYVSAPWAAKVNALTPAGATKILRRLEDVGIVEAMPDTRPRLYVAGALIRLLEAPTAAARPG